MGRKPGTKKPCTMTGLYQVIHTELFQVHHKQIELHQ